MKKLIKPLCVLLAAVVFFLCYSGMVPISHSKCVSEQFADESILFESGKIELGKDDGCLVTATDNKSFYRIALLNCNDGWLNNQYQVDTTYTYYSENMANLERDGADVSDLLNTPGKDADTGLYIGTVPLSCKSLTFDGVPAKLVEQNVTIDGKNYAFYLYYLAAKASEDVEILYVNTDGEVVPIEIEEF